MLRGFHSLHRPALPQSVTQTFYSTYDDAHLKPIVQHVAKNLVMVNDGRSKFQVSKTNWLACDCVSGT